jgi:membrane associated rhomboid family serine protease
MNEYRPGGLSMPPVVKNLLIINVLVFIAQQTFKNNPSFSIDHFFGLHDIHSIYFKPHQIVSYMFLHGGFDHILFNMLALWMFGSMLEQVWGSKRFLTFYVLCGIGAGILHLGVLYLEMKPIYEALANYPSNQQTEQFLRDPGSPLNGITVGASGSIFGCLAAFGYLFPNMLIYVYFLFPVKAKWFVLFYGGLELYLGIRNSAGDNVAHWAHLGGALVGIIIVLIWNKKNRRRFY